MTTREASLLPESEKWSDATWKYLRLVLLAFLKQRGGRTTEELVRDDFAPGPAFYPFNRAEVAAVVESARRRGLLAVNPNPEAGIGAAPEWIPSEKGTGQVQELWSWASAQARVFGGHLGLAAPLLAALGVGTLLAAREGVVGVYLGFAALVALGFALPVLWARANGFAGRDDFIRDWSRLNLEREDWARRWLKRRKPGWAATATAAAFAGFSLATIFYHVLSFAATTSLVLAAAAYLTYVLWGMKQKELLIEAQFELDRLQRERIRAALTAARAAEDSRQGSA